MKESVASSSQGKRTDKRDGNENHMNPLECAIETKWSNIK